MTKLTLITKTISCLFFLTIFSSSAVVAQMQLDKTLVYDGETRSYTVYIPASYQGTSNVPLLFNFHGGNGDIASQLYVSDMRPLAEADEFILVYPQALGDPNDGNSANWTHKEPTTHDDIFFVEAMIDELATEYMIDQNRVYGCGYSNGGEFCFDLACRLSHRIAAIGVVARSMYIETFNTCAPTYPIGIVTIHGTEDEYNGLVWGGVTYYISLDDTNEYWSNYNNTNSEAVILDVPNTNTSDGSTVEHHIWENGDGCVSVEHFKVINGGHDWPGTFGNMDIDASVEIWNYVSQYDINGLIDCDGTSVLENIESNNRITIYPNPTTDFLTIDMDGNTQQSIEVYSMVGKLLMSEKIHSNTQTIDVSHLSSNIYFLKIGGDVLKFVKGI